MLFQANFEDGKIPDRWVTESGWKIENGALCGNQHSFTGNTVTDTWQDYVAKFRLKVDKGTIHLNLRHLDNAGTRRYFIKITPGEGVSLGKQAGEKFTNDLASLEQPIEPGKWFDIQLVAQGNRILMLVNDIIFLDYVDPDPFQSGGLSFETLENSSACIDNIIVSDLTGKPPFDLLYEQHFENAAKLTGWSIFSARAQSNQAWQIKDGAFCGTGHNWATFNEKQFADFVATFRLSIKNGRIHLNFRIGPDRRYRIWLGPGGASASLFKDVKDKPNLLLITGPVRILPDKWYDVTIGVSGGRFQFWVNGKRVYDFTDKDALPGGTIGFEALDSKNVCIDDFVLTMPSLMPNLK